MLRRILFTGWIICGISGIGIGQPTFQLKLTEPTNSPALFRKGIAYSANSVKLVRNFWDHLDVLHLSDAGNLLAAYSIREEQLDRRWRSYRLAVNGNKCLILAGGLGNSGSTENAGGILLVDLVSQSCLGVKTNDNFLAPGNGFFLPDGRIALAYSQESIINGTFNNRLRVTAMQNTTEELLIDWIFDYEIENEGDLGYASSGMAVEPSGELLVLGHGYSSQLDEWIYFLLRIDQNGNLLASVGVRDSRIRIFDLVVDNNGDIYVAGAITSSPVWSEEPKREGFIIKLNADLEFIWGKRLSVAHFVQHRMELELRPDGELMFVYTMFGHLPVIVGQVSPEGMLLETTGLPLFDPTISITEEGEALFLSSKQSDEWGNLSETFEVVKTDTTGQVASCPEIPVCLELIDLSLEFEPLDWLQYPAPEPERLFFEMEPTEYTSEEVGCSSPPIPDALFEIPDTICAAHCISPEGYNNRFAHRVEWQLSGPGLDTVLVDTTFQWCFTQAGEYLVTQTIWLFGCPQSYEEQLTVLADDLSPPLGDDRLLCTDDPFILVPESSRPLREWLWWDGSLEPTLTVGESGTYTLEATDGYCSVQDTVTITLLSDWLMGEAIQLPDGVEICQDDLPYELRPSSALTSLFTLQPSGGADSVFALPTAGTYPITALVGGCAFTETFTLDVSDCQSLIYIPNIFSPNQDGINDWLEPQGLDFIGLRLEVFDRWGGLVHQTATAPFRWDGRSLSAPVPEGVYVLIFHYRNVLTGTEEQAVQDVMLVR